MKRITRLITTLVITPTLLIASQNVSAQTLTPQYRPDYLSVPAAALLPRDNTIAYDTNGVRMFTTDPGQVVFQAPITLPNWSWITNITLEAVDKSSDPQFGGFVRVNLREYQFNAFSTLATVQTDAPTAPGDVRVGAPVGHVVDNDQFSYGLEVTLFNGAGGPGTVGLYKVVIEYWWPEMF